MRRKRRSSMIVRVALLCFAVYAAFTIVRLQVDISRKSNELKEIQTEIDSVREENTALRESLELGNSDSYIASIARENGYAVSGERVMIDTSSK